MDSDKAGVAQKADEILVLEERNHENGVTRVRCSKGWLSVNASDGSAILATVE